MKCPVCGGELNYESLYGCDSYYVCAECGSEFNAKYFFERAEKAEAKLQAVKDNLQEKTDNSDCEYSLSYIMGYNDATREIKKIIEEA